MAENFHALFIATVSMLCATRIELIISKDSGKTYAAKALRLWDFRNLFCIFLALPELLKIIRALSILTIIKYRPSSINKDGSNLSNLRLDSQQLCSFQELNDLILEHTGYLWFVKKLKCCF